MILTVILGGISKAATVLSALMKMYTIPCHDRGYFNIMLVLQSSDPLRILTDTTSDGVCNFSNMEVKQDVDIIEEAFMSINEEVDRGMKQEEIPGDLNLPDIKSEPDGVSYFCMSVIGHILPVSGISTFFSFCGVNISGQLKQLHCWE